MSASAVFDEIVGSRWDDVLDWKAQARKESLHLDFKVRERGIGPGKLGDADKNCISKAFSGFANVDGGVLVIGVSAKAAAKDAPDTVGDIVPIDDVKQFENLVDRNLKNFTNPPIPGIRLHSIAEPGQAGGILAIYVPRSDGAPHRAAMADKAHNDRYYMRTGTSTVIMPHPLLAAMFGRRPEPQLRLVADLEIGQPNQLILRLLNRGRGYARQPALLFEANEASHLDWQQLRNGMLRAETVQSSGGQTVVGFLPGSQDIVVYPGWEIVVGTVTVKSISYNAGYNLRLVGRILALETQPIEFDEQFNIELKNATFVLPKDDETATWVSEQRVAENARRKAAKQP